MMKRIKIDKAQKKHLTGRVRLKEYRPPNLISYGAKQTRRGVTYKIRRGGKRELLKSAFIAPLRAGHDLVFKRTGPRRYPIKAQPGPSVNDFIKQEQIDVEARELVNGKLDKRIRARVQLLIERAAAGLARGGDEVFSG